MMIFIHCLLRQGNIRYDGVVDAERGLSLRIFSEEKAFYTKPDVEHWIERKKRKEKEKEKKAEKKGEFSRRSHKNQ